MIAIAGIFARHTDAERAIERLRAVGIADERLALLSPSASDEEVEERAQPAETDGPGTGEKAGGAFGRGIGITGGIMLGGAVGSFFVPGVGAVIAAGALAAALLGTGGAAIGAAVGGALDHAAAENLRRDNLHLYEAALRQGRTALVALASDERQADAAQEILADAGAVSLDEARENWWRELRAAEEEAYAREGRDFALDETPYRRGFEAGLHPRLRDKRFAEATDFLVERHADDYMSDAFRRGYERGQEYQRDLLEKFSAK